MLPVTDALPPEFQLPNRVRGRGQVVRFSLSGDDNFAIDEKINLNGCYLEKCRLGMRHMIQAAFPAIFRTEARVEAARRGMLEPTSSLKSSPARNPGT